MPLEYDPYADAKAMEIFQEVGEHDFSQVNAGEIVMRIMQGRQAFEERQRRKGQKAVGEEAAREREMLEEQMNAATEAYNSARPDGGDNADYQMRLMLLEQSNKKWLKATGQM